MDKQRIVLFHDDLTELFVMRKVCLHVFGRGAIIETSTDLFDAPKLLPTPFTLCLIGIPLEAHTKALLEASVPASLPFHSGRIFLVTDEVHAGPEDVHTCITDTIAKSKFGVDSLRRALDRGFGDADPQTGVVLNDADFAHALSLRLDKADRDSATILARIQVKNFSALDLFYDEIVCRGLTAETGKRLCKYLPDDSLLGAVDKATFLVTLTRDSEKDAQKAIERAIRKMTARPFADDGLRLSFSAGAAFAPSHGSSAQELNLYAYDALISSHRLSDTLVIYSGEISGHQQRRAMMLSRLEAGLLNSELVVVYQAEYGHDDKVAGAQAFIHWESPELGLIPAKELMPIAEEADLLDDLSYYFINKVFNHLQRLERSLVDNSDFTVCINIAPQSILSNDFVTALLNTPEYLRAHAVLEFSEPALEGILEQFDDFIDSLDRLKLAGFRVSVDTFGFGEVSQSNIMAIQPFFIKLDPAIVSTAHKNDGHAQFLKLTDSIAYKLDLISTFAGIDSKECYDFLRSNLHRENIRYQGDYISPLERFGLCCERFNKSLEMKLTG